MQIAGFEFKDGYRPPAGVKVEATAVGEHLELLRKQHQNELTPEDVLADAANNNSPLHPLFNWDDTAAAREWRLHQARGLIRSVVAIYTSTDQPAVRMRAYVHVPEGETSHYRETSHAMSQKKTREIVLSRAWRELQQWRDRYKDLSTFAKLIPIIDEIGKAISKKVG